MYMELSIYIDQLHYTYMSISNYNFNITVKSISSNNYCDNSVESAGVSEVDNLDLIHNHTEFNT